MYDKDPAARPGKGPEKRPETAPPKQKQVDPRTATALGDTAINADKKK